jgi:hypothetical protein
MLLADAKLAEHGVQNVLNINQSRNLPYRLRSVPKLLRAQDDIFRSYRW